VAIYLQKEIIRSGKIKIHHAVVGHKTIIGGMAIPVNRSTNQPIN
jgi:hypothetical protein